MYGVYPEQLGVLAVEGGYSPAADTRASREAVRTLHTAQSVFSRDM